MLRSERSAAADAGSDFERQHFPLLSQSHTQLGVVAMPVGPAHHSNQRRHVARGHIAPNTSDLGGAVRALTAQRTRHETEAVQSG